MESEPNPAVMLFMLAAFSALCGTISYKVAAAKEAETMGLLLGILLGPLGILISFMLDNRRQCFACRTRVDKLATVCPACHNAIPPLPPPITRTNNGW